MVGTGRFDERHGAGDRPPVAAPDRSREVVSSPILGWTELRNTRERKLVGTVHHKEVEVEVDRTAVRSEARSAPTTGPFAWRPATPPSRSDSSWRAVDLAALALTRCSSSNPGATGVFMTWQL